jgi:hypothetical protein
MALGRSSCVSRTDPQVAFPPRAQKLATQLGGEPTIFADAAALQDQLRMREATCSGQRLLTPVRMSGTRTAAKGRELRSGTAMNSDRSCSATQEK